MIYDLSSVYQPRKSGAYQMLRGVNEAVSTTYSSDKSDTEIADLADKKAQNEDDKSGITVALEDFTDAMSGLHGYSSSNLDSSDTKTGFFGSGADNIFKTEQGQEIVAKRGNVFQSDLYESEYNKNGGIRYAKNVDDMAQAAINFAKANIAAIEKANKLANGGNTNGKLEVSEIGTYTNFNGVVKNVMEDMNITGGKSSLTAEEYAAYMMVADGLSEVDGVTVRYDSSKMDGLVTEEEARLMQDLDDEELQALAKRVYDQYIR